MDKIEIRNIKLYGYHGVFPEEREKGQNFFVDVEIYFNSENAGKSDELVETIDYTKIYDIIKGINNNNKFRLIERFAHIISQEILSEFEEIHKTVVRIRKPDAPMDGDFDWVGIEIVRTRGNA